MVRPGPGKALRRWFSNGCVAEANSSLADFAAALTSLNTRIGRLHLEGGYSIRRNGRFEKSIECCSRNTYRGIVAGLSGRASV